MFYDDVNEKYYLHLSKEKVNSRGAADSVSIFNEIGESIIFFEKNVRQYLNLKLEDMAAMWLNLYGYSLSNYYNYLNL